MGLVRDILTEAVGFIREEILPVRTELVKAGIISPPKPSDFEPKSSLTDPWSYNTMNYGYKEKYTFLDYPRMKQISYADPIISAIIMTRQNEVASQSMVQGSQFENGFKIRLRDKSAKPSGAAKKKIEEMERFISNCGFPETFENTPQLRKRDNFETFLRKVVRDSLTYDQVNFEIVPRVNGLPGQFMAVDAATIKIVPDRKEREDMFIGYDRKVVSQHHHLTPPIATVPGRNINEAKMPHYCQVIEGQIRAVYDEWEMAFGVRNPRTDILSNGYGFSELEMLITIITAHLNADTYNRRFFSHGSAIKGLIAFEGSVPPDQLEAFRRQWHQQVSGVANSWKTPIVALGKDGKLNWQSLHTSNRDMEWGKYVEYLIKVMCAVYQIDPIEIGFDISKQSMGSAGSGGLSQGDSLQKIELSKDKGLSPLLRFIASMMNDYIVWRIDEDFIFEFPKANKEDDAMDLAEKQIKTIKTVNEVRAEYDLKPLPEKVEDYKGPGDFIMSQEFLSAFTTIQGIQHPEMQGDAMGGGAPGAEGEDGELPPEDPEPDYENMSTEELQAELAKIEGGSQDKAEKSERFEYLM